MPDFINNKKINRSKLLHFGFKEENGSFIYSESILNNQFKFFILIDNKDKINTTLIETATKEIYTLHLVEDVCGSFVGKIKEEYDAILAKISEQCFESDIFKTRQANDLIEYIREKYNDELEFLWQKFSGNAIVRRKDNLKWYAAFLTVSKQKFGFEDSSSVEIIDLRTENIDQIVDNKTIFPGYHMNKKHWITIILDGSVSLDFIKNKIDLSYELANKNKKI